MSGEPTLSCENARHCGGSARPFERMFIAALPEQRRKQVEARFDELKQEVESLRALRRVAGKAQADIASALDIKQPSVSKIEKQADMYLSTLRSCVEAIGGELDLVVRLPSRPPLRIERLGDVVSEGSARSRLGSRTPSAPSKRGAQRRG